MRSSAINNIFFSAESGKETTQNPLCYHLFSLVYAASPIAGTKSLHLSTVVTLSATFGK